MSEQKIDSYLRGNVAITQLAWPFTLHTHSHTHTHHCSEALLLTGCSHTHTHTHTHTHAHTHTGTHTHAPHPHCKKKCSAAIILKRVCLPGCVPDVQAFYCETHTHTLTSNPTMIQTHITPNSRRDCSLTLDNWQPCTTTLFLSFTVSFVCYSFSSSSLIGFKVTWLDLRIIEKTSDSFKKHSLPQKGITNCGCYIKRWFQSWTLILLEWIRDKLIKSSIYFLVSSTEM